MNLYFELQFSGEELRESNDSISVAANDESANSAGGSADQNKNQLVPKSWWMSNTQIKKEKGNFISIALMHSFNVFFLIN